MLKKGYFISALVALIALAMVLVCAFAIFVNQENVANAEEDRPATGYYTENSYIIDNYVVEDYEEGVKIIGFYQGCIPSVCYIPRKLDNKNVVALSSSFLVQNAVSQAVYALVIPNTVRYCDADLLGEYTHRIAFFEGDTTGFDPNWNIRNQAYVTNVTIGSYKYQGDYFWQTKTAYYVESFMDTDVHNKESDTAYSPIRFGRTHHEKNHFIGFSYTPNADTADFLRLREMGDPIGQRLYSTYVHYEGGGSPSCVAEGTLVTLANGQQVPVETLTGNEELLVWDMMAGTYSSAPILFVDKEEAKECEIIELTFADGTQVKVIDEHAFFDVDTQKYVFLRNDAAKYIGHTFNKGDVNVELVAVNIYNEVTTAWSPVTQGALCLYVNGMLSMPGNTEGFINIFAVEDMKVNSELMAQDIATYGLFTYEEFCNEVVEVPEEVFEAFNGQYLKVSMAKGLITEEEIEALFDRYQGFFAEEEVEVSAFETVVNAIKSAFDSILKFFGLKK